MTAVLRKTARRGSIASYCQFATHSVLLLTAVLMATALLPYPAYHPFLVAKVSGVVLYILLGMTAFRWAKSRRTQAGAWLAAQATFFYVVGVAVTKGPWPGLG